MEFCTSLFQGQIELAEVEHAPPNTSVKGDASARAAFLMLLSDSQQRELFIKIGSQPSAWPRLKGLVGAPPYHFLKPGDAGMLNAAGFAHRRIHMTYEELQPIANQSQFGPGQFEDEHSREYRVAETANADGPIPVGDFFKLGCKDILLHVRVKKTGVQKKRELFHSDQRKRLLFPQPGEIVTLQETRQMLAVCGLQTATKTQLRIKGLWPRGAGACTAAVLVGY